MKVSDEIQQASGEIQQAPAERKKMSGEVKLFIGILVGAVVLGGAAIAPMLLPGGPGQEHVMPGPTPIKKDRATLVPPGSHIRGNPDAPFSLVVFSDLQCSHCRDAEKKLPDLLETYKGKLNIVYRHFRIQPRHINAMTLAQAAEAAGKQGKFFEMIGQIFEHQDLYETAALLDVKNHTISMAGAMGLDVKKFRADMDSRPALEAWKRDNDLGIDLNIQGTPMFYFVPLRGQAIGLAKPSDMFAWLADPKHWQENASPTTPGKS